MELLLRISPAAAKFIRRMFDVHAEEMAIVVSGVIIGTQKTTDRDGLAARSFEEIAAEGRNLVENLPHKIQVEYVIGMKELGRLRQEDVYIVQGIKCYLPASIIALVGSREIVLDDGKLRFEPPLEVQEIVRTRRSH